MAFTVTFPTSRPLCTVDDLSAWLTDRGEPFAVTEESLTLRAFPMRFVVAPEQAALQCQIEVTEGMPVQRMVDVVFDVSVQAGADVHLVGEGQVSRAFLWMRLADDQDRVRLAAALSRAEASNNRDEILRRLWGILAAARFGHDDRWDAAQERVVELLEVGEGISLDDAAWHAEDPEVGDVVHVPVKGMLHCLAWRWLSEAYPGIAEAEHTIH
jgi:hypothetical protein